MPTHLDHQDSDALDIRAVVRSLVDRLGPTLVATVAGVRDRSLPDAWARDGGPEPSPGADVRLRTAHFAWETLSAESDGDTIRTWFIGANPRLGDESPVLWLRSGRVFDVLSAVAAFSDGTSG